MDEQKKWYKSKTIWTNAVVLAGSIFSFVGWIEADLSPETVALVLVVINTILRFVTKEEISW